MTILQRPPRSLAAVVAAALLAGCASGYHMETAGQSFSGLPAQPANLAYTFERLPSQAALQPAQAQIEALADPALFKVGFRRNDAAPRYTVQVSARIQRIPSPWPDPWDPWWGGPPWGYPRPGFGYGLGGPFPRMENWFLREVGLVVREVGTSRVVYETHATNEGPWLDQDAALAALFDSALQGFPQPPQGVRRVNVQLGGKRPAAVPQAAPGAAPAGPAATPAAPAAVPVAPAAPAGPAR